MKKNIITILVLLTWTISLSAQITREKADEIVSDYLKNEGMQETVLYVYDKEPDKEGVSLTIPYCEEIITAKYACWVYYSDESNQNRFLYVKADSGSLLEVISNNIDLLDLESWKLVENTTCLTKKGDGAKLLYPNPVNELISLPFIEDYAYVEIRDLNGSRLFSKWLSREDACQLNISFLSAGVYMMSVDGETYKVIKN